MKTTSTDRRSDVMYKVDPKRLSIKLCYTAPATSKLAECPTTFENFSYEKAEMKSDVPEQLGTLPACVNGVFYFKTEEEAHEFIRTQIGL